MVVVFVVVDVVGGDVVVVGGDVVGGGGDVVVVGGDVVIYFMQLSDCLRGGGCRVGGPV